MKKTILLLFSMALATLSFAQNVTPKEYPSPDFANQPAYYDPATNSLKSLEKMSSNVDQHITSPWTAKRVAYFPNTKSSVRLAASKKLSFIILMETTTQDPDEILKLYKLDVNNAKSRREMTLAKGNIAGSKSTKMDLPISVKKIGTGLYLLEVEPLVAGEYIIDTPKFDFGFGAD